MPLLFPWWCCHGNTCFNVARWYTELNSACMDAFQMPPTLNNSCFKHTDALKRPWFCTKHFFFTISVLCRVYLVHLVRLVLLAPQELQYVHKACQWKCSTICLLCSWLHQTLKIFTQNLKPQIPLLSMKDTTPCRNWNSFFFLWNFMQWIHKIAKANRV